VRSESGYANEPNSNSNTCDSSQNAYHYSPSQSPIANQVSEQVPKQKQFYILSQEYY
jgi:hypothetical protein